MDFTTISFLDIVTEELAVQVLGEVLYIVTDPLPITKAMCSVLNVNLMSPMCEMRHTMPTSCWWYLAKIRIDTRLKQPSSLRSTLSRES